METGREGGGEGCFGQARQFCVSIYTYTSDVGLGEGG